MTSEITIKKDDAVAVQEPVGMDAFLQQVALDPNVDAQKLHSLLDFKERIMRKDAEMSFNRDYLAAKLEMPRVKKDGAVEYLEDKTNKNSAKVTAFKYAKYEDIDKAIRPIEEKYGFSRLFTTSPRVGEGGGTIVHCMLIHRDGHSIEAEISVALDASGGKNNIQAMGSSFSYGKRYTTEMLWDIVKEGADDDANSVEMIDEKQFKKLKRLLDETGTVEADFVKYYSIEAIDQLPKRLFGTVENILLTKQVKLMKDKKNANP